MKTAVKITLGCIAAVAIAVGGELAYLHHRNAADQAPIAKVDYKSDPDDNVFLKNEHPMAFKDAKDLKGRTLWVSAGGQMDYYPYTAHTVDFAHPQGVLLGTEKILVTDAVEQVAPVKTAFRIPQGDKQVLLIFTRAANSAANQYAVPVGFRQGTDYTFSTDQIFFYDDPHILFSHWSPETWKAIDEHRAILGMNERQVQTALGQISDPHGDKIGDRTVIYDNQGKPKRITFVATKATKIEDVAP